MISHYFVLLVYMVLSINAISHHYFPPSSNPSLFLSPQSEQISTTISIHTCAENTHTRGPTVSTHLRAKTRDLRLPQIIKFAKIARVLKSPNDRVANTSTVDPEEEEVGTGLSWGAKRGDGLKAAATFEAAGGLLGLTRS